PELVHVPASDERAHRGRRQQAEGEGVGERRRDPRARRLPRRRPAADAPEAPVLALAERADDGHTVRRAGMDRVRGVRDRGAHPAAAAVPHHPGEAELGAAERRGETGRVVPVVGVRREAVELGRREAGVGAGREDRLARELELAPVGDAAPAPVLGLADTDDAHAVAHGARRIARTCHDCQRTRAGRGPRRGRRLSTRRGACDPRRVSMPSRQDLEAIARRAGGLALARFRHVAAERKADRTLVTAADREVEALLVSELTALDPDAGILGEEGAHREGRASYRYVIDPIDGTSAFVAGLGTWCICIGVLEGARPIAGVVYVPRLDETYSAVAGSAYLNGTVLPPLADEPSAGDQFIVAHAR